MKKYHVVRGPLMHFIEADFAEFYEGNRLVFMAMEEGRDEPVAAFDDGCWDYFITNLEPAGAE